MKAYYVTVKRDNRTGWLHGPHANHDDALALVPAVRLEAESVDPRAVWDAFGTSSIERDVEALEMFPRGVLNGYGDLPL